jgi:hypothetical protein
MKRPTSFTKWLETRPQDFIDRIEAGEAGNKENPMIAARLAFEAGIRAGKILACQVLVETVFGTAIKFTEFEE